MNEPEPEVTAEDVIEAAGGKMRRPAAERLAAYANLRVRGVLPVDAAREVGVSQESHGRYNRWFVSFRRQRGLPEVPRAKLSQNNPTGAVTLDEHRVWHTRIQPWCRYCLDELR